MTMADILSRLIVLEPHPSPHSANRFQYVARGGKKYKVMIYNFTSKCLNIRQFFSFCVPILKAIGAVEWKESGLSLQCRNRGVHELGLYGTLE